MIFLIMCLDSPTDLILEFLNPTAFMLSLFDIIFSMPLKAPPAINKIFDVFSFIKF